MAKKESKIDRCVALLRQKPSMGMSAVAKAVGCSVGIAYRAKRQLNQEGNAEELTQGTQDVGGRTAVKEAESMKPRAAAWTPRPMDGDAGITVKELLWINAFGVEKARAALAVLERIRADCPEHHKKGSMGDADSIAAQEREHCD